MIARADEIRSNIVLIPDKIPLDNMSGWLIWGVVILSGFIILSLLTLFFLLSRSGFLKRKPKKKKKRPTRKSRNGSWFSALRGSPKKKSKRRAIKNRSGRSRKTGDTAKKKKKGTARKAKRKKTGVSRQLKMPFLPDPGMIRSYSSKYLVRKRIKAHWERVALTGYDSDENPLDLDVYLLTRAFQWPSGKADTIAYQKKSVNPPKYLKNKSLKLAFQKTTGLISVGLVTEMSDGDEREGLARTRSENMITWLKRVQPKATVDYRLILDSPKHEWGSVDEEDRKTDEKRSVLWICLKGSLEAVNMEEALKDALSQAIHLPFDFDIYQDVVLERVGEKP